MRQETKRLSLGIYQIDQSPYPNLDFSDLTEIIIQKINSEEDDSNSHYKIQQLETETIGEHKIRIFHARKVLPAKWRSFFKEVVAKNAEILKAKNMYSSHITFISHQSEVFAIAGGHGNFCIPRFAVQDFGMEILTRIIKKDKKVIKGLQDRGLIGNILGETKFYRGDQRFSDEDQFGKIYKQVKAAIDKKILTTIFGFPEAELKKNVSGCLAKTSFQINKSISFNSLLNVISKFNKILNEEKHFSLNKVSQISKKSNQGKKLVESLENYLIEELFKKYKEKSISDFDFCNKNFEEYLSASEYVIFRQGHVLKKYDEIFTLDSLIADLEKEEVLLSDTLEEFRYSFLEAEIIAYDEEDVRVTAGKVFEHFHGELLFEGKPYFLIDGAWYIVDPDFIKELNVDCKDCLVQTWAPNFISERFDISKSEKFFNSQFIGKDRHLVFDTITNENLELCDILKYDDDSVYLIHVKRGFNNSVRELVSQISISAKRVLNDIKSNYNFLDTIERKIKKGGKSNSPFIKNLAAQKFPANGLKSLFQSKRYNNIVFCLAFVDTGSTYRSLKDNLKDFNSNIAKVSMIGLRKELNALNFGLKIIQLQKK